MDVKRGSISKINTREAYSHFLVNKCISSNGGTDCNICMIMKIRSLTFMCNSGIKIQDQTMYEFLTMHFVKCTVTQSEEEASESNV